MARNFAYPSDGALGQYFAEGDFLDSQCAPLPHPAPDAAELTIATFFHTPGWVKALLGLRNLLVAPFGLKTGGASDLRPPTREEINGLRYSGIFAVHSATPDEVILGTDDRHLDFRVSILRSEADDVVAISTWVRPHNLAGRAYLAAVYPFHRIIIARFLSNADRLGVTR
jgi:hypothetical protein